MVKQIFRLFLMLLTMSALLYIILLSEKAHAFVPQEETRIKIAIIDTGFNVMQKNLRPFLCARGHKSFVDNEPLKDSLSTEHGTNIAGLISENIDPKKYCFLIIKFYNPEYSARRNLDTEIDSVLYAVSQKVAFINMSIHGSGSFEKERDALQSALASGIKIAVSAGNDNEDLNKECDVYPACYAQMLNPEMFHVVGSSTKHKDQSNYSNYGDIVKYKEDGTNVGEPPNTGTSQATAIHLGKWISGKVK